MYGTNVCDLFIYFCMYLFIYPLVTEWSNSLPKREAGRFYVHFRHDGSDDATTHTRAQSERAREGGETNKGVVRGHTGGV